MATIDECYNSLQVVKDNLHTLEKENEDTVAARDAVTYLIDHAALNHPVDELMEEEKGNAKHGAKLVGKNICVFYPVVMLIAKLICDKLGWDASTFYTCFTGSTLYMTSRDINRFLKNFIKYKKVKELKGYTEDDEELRNININDLYTALDIKHVDLDNKIEKIKSAIEEYEELLEDAKKDLANEVLRGAGIDAKIDVTLANTPERNKKLMKKDVKK